MKFKGSINIDRSRDKVAEFAENNRLKYQVANERMV